MAEAKKKKHAGHGFTHTHIEHHADGSHTVHHVHESDPKMDVKGGKAGLDEVHDSLQDHIGTPNPGEAEAQAGPAPAGAPAPAAAAPMPGGPAPAGPMGA